MAKVPLAVVIASGSYHYTVCQHLDQHSYSSYKTYLQIHGHTVPEVHADPVRVVTWVEGAAWVVELVTECKCLRLAVNILACFRAFWCVRINQASPDALQ